MNENNTHKNIETLGRELTWFGLVLANCLRGIGLLDDDIELAQAPILLPETWYGDFVAEHALTEPERLILILTLLPYLKPEILTDLMRDETCKTRFGSIRGKQFEGVIPTIQTALVLLGGGDAYKNLEVYELLSLDNTLLSKGIIHIGFCPSDEPFTASPLTPDQETISKICRGKPYEPLGIDFPAKKIVTPMEWEDLILAPTTLHQVEDILDWVSLKKDLSERLGMEKHLRAGFKALFYGSSGTGKTLCAGLIGKRVGMPVYRIDLSQIVSKYIGETQKNLEQLFRLSENKQWILFFDEADSLFNKRTDVENSHDRHANQETAFLLQRLENFPGLVIMATNLQNNIDSAFTRRFNCGIFFPPPERVERELLWKSCLGSKLIIDKHTIEMIQDFELSGGQIANISLRLGLWALRKNNMTLDIAMVKRAIMLEQILQGKS